MSYPTLRMRDVAPRPRYMTPWERKPARIPLYTAMVAEALGVFLFVYAGVGSQAAYTLGNILSRPFGSLFTMGLAYCIGIVLAVGICASTSGGHFSPSITVSFVIFRGFPLQKAVPYIFAQILGAYLACLLVYVQWNGLIVDSELVLDENHLYDTMMFTPTGPAGIFALYVLPGSNLKRVLLNEFVTDLVLGLAISASLDPTNFIIPPVAVPWVIGFTYATAIWGYAPVGLAANSARDVGGRMMALTIWGLQAAGGPYAAIAALTNIPATVIAFFIYDTFLSSSYRVVTPQYAAMFNAHRQFYEDNGLGPSSYRSEPEPSKDLTSSRLSNGKPDDEKTIQLVARNV